MCFDLRELTDMPNPQDISEEECDAEMMSCCCKPTNIPSSADCCFSRPTVQFGTIATGQDKKPSYR